MLPHGISATSAASGGTENASLLLSGIGHQLILIWCVEQQKMEQDMAFMAFISKQLTKLKAALDTMRDKIEHDKRPLTDLESTIDNFRAKANALVKEHSGGTVWRLDAWLMPACGPGNPAFAAAGLAGDV